MSFMSELDAMLPVDCCDPLNGCTCCDRSDPCDDISDYRAEFDGALYGASVGRDRAPTFDEQLGEARCQREKRYTVAVQTGQAYRPYAGGI